MVIPCYFGLQHRFFNNFPFYRWKKNSCLTLTVLCYRRDWMISLLQVLQLRIILKLLKKEKKNKVTHPFEGPVFFKVGRRQELIENSLLPQPHCFLQPIWDTENPKNPLWFFPRSYRWSEPSGNRTKMEESRCFTRLQNWWLFIDFPGCNSYCSWSNSKRFANVSGLPWEYCRKPLQQMNFVAFQIMIPTYSGANSSLIVQSNLIFSWRSRVGGVAAPFNCAMTLAHKNRPEIPRVTK